MIMYMEEYYWYSIWIHLDPFGPYEKKNAGDPKT
jgi:hypothetical protein